MIVDDHRERARPLGRRRGDLRRRGNRLLHGHPRLGARERRGRPAPRAARCPARAASFAKLAPRCPQTKGRRRRSPTRGGSSGRGRSGEPYDKARRRWCRTRARARARARGAGAGAREIGDKIAPRISHPPYTSCVQCHAAASDPRPGGTPAKVAGNTFLGLPSPSAGTRGQPTAPPTIPHSTWMRDQCGSCHGPTGLMGMRTTHPWRQQCVQCHAASITDSHPTKKLAPLGWSAPQ